MDFREKDTAIILVCCMLVVLLVIFFLSERQKFILNNYETSREGCFDQYECSVKKYKPGNGPGNRELILSRSLVLNRTLVDIGADNKGTMYLEVRADKSGSQNAFYTEYTGAVDLRNQFLPEGSFNFNFFDADLVNFRGEVVRKGETWKFLRPLSLYGSSEKTVEIHYTFLGKKKHFSKNTGYISFDVPDKTWLEGGLKRVENLEGVFLVSEETGKIEEMECSYYRGDEKSGYYYEINLKRVKTRTLSNDELASLRKKIDVNGSFARQKTGVRKSVVPMIARGDSGKLEKKLFAGKKEDLFAIQVRAFTEREKALDLYRKLKSKQWNNVNVLRKGSLYKVCVGKYTKDSAALKSHFTILKRFFPDAFVFHPQTREFQRDIPQQ